MIEAIDAQRKKLRDRRKIVTVATGKISRAMIAATLTAALSFVPLIFVGGILGKFIRAIPITIISALGISLLVALIFIPFFAKLLLLRKKQIGEGNVKEFATGAEASIARAISKPMRWAKGSGKKLVSVGMVAVMIGLIFIGTGSWLFQKVTFNIFPPTKDSNQLTLSVTFPPNTDIERAQKITDEADKIVAEVIGIHFQKASYYGQANVQSAIMFTDITPYDERDIKAPEIVDQIDARFVNFKEAKVKAAQADVGPPAATFSARVDSSQNRPAAIKLANDIAAFLSTTELKRLDGSVAKLQSVEVTNTSIYNRDNGNQFVEVGAKFIDDDTSTLVTLAQQAVEKKFSPEKVAAYGLDSDSVSFNFGQEDENQDSFKTLALAFPILLVAIYILLAFQFKSMLQPLLIFLAIPFSIFGITLGLYSTDNAFSFFTMMGFFALIGLSIKNTILLTDYANQARRAGMGPVDAAHEALAERFRPLIATSLTAVFSLIPLTLTSPFWEGLGVVLICGLLSSTLLVITVFPYYYLGSEFLRARFSRKTGILWLILTIALLVALSKLTGPAALLAPFLAALILVAPKKLARSKV
jgi:multidrug efflux pump subunit AcrB